MPTKREEIAEKVIAEYNAKFRSKDSPPLDARQMMQFNWIIDQVWGEAVLALCPEVRKTK
jgi:hypothetical protein